MLILRPLAEDDFASFGTILRSVPGRRIAYPETTEPGDKPGKAVFSIATHQPVETHGSLMLLERHPYSNQSFLPLDSGRWMVAVAPATAEGLPDLERLVAFVAGPADAVCIHKGVWHAPMTVFDRPADMAMLMWRTHAGDDTEELALPSPVAFQLP